MKLDVKTNKHQMQSLLRLTIRDAAPESYQVTQESLENFESSLIRIKVKNENDAIQYRISNFDRRRISQPKNQSTN